MTVILYLLLIPLISSSGKIDIPKSKRLRKWTSCFPSDIFQGSEKWFISSMTVDPAAKIGISIY